MSRLIPVWRKESAQYFVDTAKVALCTVMVDTCEVLTAPLKFGQPVDLLGISQTEELISDGFADCTDIIDADMSLKEIYFEIAGHGVRSVDLKYCPLSKFIYAPTDYSFRVMRVHCTVTAHINGISNQSFVFSVTGQVNREIGNIRLSAEVVSAEGFLGIESVEMLGFDLDAKRENLNRRHRQTPVEPAVTQVDSDSMNKKIDKFSTDGLVLVPRGLIGAACYVLRKNDPESKTIVLLRNITMNQPDHVSPTASESKQLDFVSGLEIAKGVFARYKVGQRKWWNRLDGTPMLNDIAVRMTEAFLKGIDPDQEWYELVVKEEEVKPKRRWWNIFNRD